MPRPKKCRYVDLDPEAVYFKPQGVPMTDLQEATMSLDELEALRLADYLNLSQDECAQRMEISRPTFSRIVAGARKTVAGALLNGKAIKIEGAAHVEQKRSGETKKHKRGRIPVCQTNE